MNTQLDKKPASSIKPGTVWQLGDHRLAYGDCRDEKLLARLIGKGKIHLICADVPYGVGVVESKRNFQALSKDKIIQNDQLQSDVEYATFSKAWLDAVKPFLAKKNAAYIFNADKMIWPLHAGIIDAGFKFAQLLCSAARTHLLRLVRYPPLPPFQRQVSAVLPASV